MTLVVSFFAIAFTFLIILRFLLPFVYSLCKPEEEKVRLDDF